MLNVSDRAYVDLRQDSIDTISSVQWLSAFCQCNQSASVVDSAMTLS